MPEVSIFAAYSAGATIPTRAEVPDVVTANRIKGLAGHKQSAYVFARLIPHDFDKRCPCFACVREPKGDWKPIPWTGHKPRPLYVRFDIGARNVRLKVAGGEFFVVVAEYDVSDFLTELQGRDRRGLALALPLVIERTSKKEVSAVDRDS